MMDRRLEYWRSALRASLIAFVTTAHAEVLPVKTDWEVSLQADKRKNSYHNVQSWLLPPRIPLESKARVLVTIDNQGPREQEAVLLRYALSAKLAKVDQGDKDPGIWTIPFIVEDRRAPRVLLVGSKEDIAISFDRKLAAYLKKVYQFGFWPKALQIQILVEPRSSESLRGHQSQQIIEVLWRPASASGAKTEKRHE